jgi:hypothetical protein
MVTLSVNRDIQIAIMLLVPPSKCYTPLVRVCDDEEGGERDNSNIFKTFLDIFKLLSSAGSALTLSGKEYFIQKN